jgi:hypothetical protein
MVNIQDLFKYKKPVEIKDAKGEIVMTLWVRLLGDYDLSEAYRLGRVASAKTRRELRDTSSDEYLAEVSLIEDGENKDLIELIKQSQQTELLSRAQSEIDRKDIPKIEDFAMDPDAPTLEEQEKRDKAELQNEIDYQKKVIDYVTARNLEITQRLEALDRETLIGESRKAMANLRSLTTFIQEVINQKAFRGVYLDKECKRRAFLNYEDYLNQSTALKQQIEAAYQDLEVNPEDIKN